MATWLPQSEFQGTPDTFCRFVARQPILDRAQRTVGYELLFRNSWENRFCADGEAASQHMIDNAVSYGMDSLVGDTLPFINCTRDLLLRRLPTLLPFGTVLEVLEDIAVDDDLIGACIDLKKLGYRLALDDFDFTPRWDPLLPLVDYIKLDFLSSTHQQMVNLMNRLRGYPIQFVAEKVETHADFLLAMDTGFTLFQGYFFHRPVVVARPSLSTMVNRLRFLAELANATLNRDRMVRLLKEEPSVSYRLLRLANSVAISAREPMTSLRAALAMIGDEQFRKLALLALATEFTGGNSIESIRYILQRARFCELLAPELGMEPAEMYLLGMLSVVRSTLNLSSADMSQALQLRPELLAALEGEQNRYGNLLQLATSYEEGSWQTLSNAAASLHLPEDKACTASAAARQWTEEILRIT